MALKKDGSVWTWGHNSNGQLGNGTADYDAHPIPQQVQGITDVVAVAAGGYNTFAIKQDGTVWAWGRNGEGQLGDGTTTDKYVPVQVVGLTGVTDIASGLSQTIALKSDGTVWTWGSNYLGQLGDGTTIDKVTPVQVTGLTDVIDVESGRYYAIALKSDGTIWTWGSNNHGQLGNGTVDYDAHPIPAQVAGLIDVKAIASGGWHAIAIKNDGSVWVWGRNIEGQLGIGTNDPQLTPVQITELTNIKVATGSYYNSMAIDGNGTVWIWGENRYGQLGDGTTINKNYPVRVFECGTTYLTNLSFTSTINSAKEGSPVNLSAQLSLENGGPADLSGKTVVFAIGNDSATGITDSSGNVNVTIPLTQPASSIPYPLTITFNGDANLAPSTFNNYFTITSGNQPVNPSVSINSVTFTADATGQNYTATISGTVSPGSKVDLEANIIPNPQNIYNPVIGPINIDPNTSTWTCEIGSLPTNKNLQLTATAIDLLGNSSKPFTRVYQIPK